VATQRADRASTLHLCRDLIRLRRRTPDLVEGAYRSVDAADGVWAYRRGEATLVALNFGAAEAAVGGGRGRVVMSSDRRREGAQASGELCLAPGEGAVVALG
jgi:alpha-glucosidase